MLAQSQKDAYGSTGRKAVTLTNMPGGGRIHVRGMSDGSHPSDMSGHLPGSGLSLDLQHVQSEQEAHARAWEALKRKEREAAESTDDTLKPAASLTRVDSDTLKVSPSPDHTAAHKSSFRSSMKSSSCAFLL